MKIVDRKTFLKLSENTLFSKFELASFGPLEIKTSNCGLNDFGTQQIHDAVKCDSSEEEVEILLRSIKDGSSFEMDFDCGGRDGMFDDDQLFAVWETKDVLDLISRLQRCVRIEP